MDLLLVLLSLKITLSTNIVI